MNVIARNPYVAGNPVGDSPAFIGRQDVMRAVLRVLRHEQQNAIVLYGQRRIGKTSILQHLQAQLPEEGPYCPVYFDLQDKASLSLGRVLQDLAEAIAYALGQPAPDLGPDPRASFRDEWLPATLAALPEGSAVVLLLDEFDVLAEAGAEQAAKAFFPYLRGLLASDPARLQFEFVIGRNIDDLDNIALSVFKGTEARRISLVSREDCAELVRLSEANGTLFWPDDAVERIWELTSGHPFLTQRLCSDVWERAYDEGTPPEASSTEDADEPPSVAVADVDAAVPEALDASRNTMEWLWDGLPPAERVVASALAEAGSAAITPEGLERLLRESGVRVVIRELQSAPQLLQDWDLIEPADGGYRFRVELLRRWIVENKPLSRVQEELDYVEPVAENLYQAALGMYQGGQLEGAVDLLQRAIALNPNHVRANQLLADLLLAQGKPDEAAEVLERLFEYQPAAARPRLVQTFLVQALEAVAEDKQLALYERALALDPAHPEASAAKRRIWKRRGDTALEAGDLEAALSAYQTAGLADSVAQVETASRRQALSADLETLEKAERGKAYQQALDLARILAERYPEDRDWAPDLERLERKTRLKELYQQGLGALQSGDSQTAQSLLAEVVSLEPGYEEATRYLHLAVSGVDVVDLQDQLEAAKEAQPQAESAAGVAQTAAQHRLSSQKPLDLFRLLWWVLVQPDKLMAYREAFGQQDERRVGKWLVSTLTWSAFGLMLFLQTSAFVRTGRVSGGLIVTLSKVPMLLVWILPWALTGWLGDRDGKRQVWLAPLVAIVFVGCTMLAVYCEWHSETWRYFVLSEDATTYFCIVVALFSLAIGLVRGIAAVITAGVVDRIVSGVLVGVLISVAAGLVLFTPTWKYWDVKPWWIVALGGILGIVAAWALPRVLRKSLETGSASWAARGSFVVLLLVPIGWVIGWFMV